jgi:2-dehydro-3-deoxygluconokinase
MSTQYDFITLGEAMLRLSPPAYQKIAQAGAFDIQVGGAESNVAINLAQLGFRTAWLSRLPDTPLGRRLAAAIAAHGVDTGGVRFAPGERLGLYFVELGPPPRPNRVIYDRTSSAASRMSSADVDFARIAQAAWLHLTGITPALSPTCRAMTADVLRFARERGLTVSFDVNYRASLWPPDEAAQVLLPLLSLCHYVFVAHRDGQHLFGAPAEPSEAAAALRTQFGCQVLVMTLGDAGAIAQTETEQVTVPQPFRVVQIIDRIGAGDAFAAGFMAACRWGQPLADALRYGHALSALKLTLPGDLALFSRAEVEQLIAGDGPASLR